MLQLSQEGTPFAAADPREDCLLEQIHRPTTGISAPREQWAPAALWFCLVGHYVSSTAFLQGGISPLLRATVFRGPHRLVWIHSGDPTTTGQGRGRGGSGCGGLMVNHACASEQEGGREPRKMQGSSPQGGCGTSVALRARPLIGARAQDVLASVGLGSHTHLIFRPADVPTTAGSGPGREAVLADPAGRTGDALCFGSWPRHGCQVTVLLGKQLLVPGFLALVRPWDSFWSPVSPSWLPWCACMTRSGRGAGCHVRVSPHPASVPRAAPSLPV